MIQEDILLEALKQKGYKLDSKELKEETQLFHKSLEELLVEKNLIAEDALAVVKGEILNLPVKIFDKKEVVDKNILNIIEESAARNYKVAVFNKDNDYVYIAALYPEDNKCFEAMNFIAKQLGVKLKLYVTTYSGLQRIWRNYGNFAENLANILKELQQKIGLQLKQGSSAQNIVNFKTIESTLVEEAPIIKLISTILTEAVRLGASDVHFEPTQRVLRVRFRVDGVLYTAVLLPLDIHSAIISRIKIMSSLQIDEMRIPQDGRFRTIIDEKPIDFRVSTFPTSYGEKVAIRVLDPTVGLLGVHQLGLNNYEINKVNTAIARPYGMILVSGPTGSGKTTTLYALLQKLNKDADNIVTLEDPVEYTLEGINQSQVLPEINYTFARGLRHIVRQDPDIIMVGEIRDSETAELAIHAALTGHLVLSTIHTNNAIGVIPRLLDLGIQKFLIPSTLNMVISQRLVRKLCPLCKKEREANIEETQIIDEALKNMPKELIGNLGARPYKIFDPVGCSECNNKGYKGRVGLFEVLEMSPQMENIILGNMSETQLQVEAQKAGMITLRQDAILKVLSGTTSIEEAISET
ncbi:MAG TPA: GspE/PulE family protein [Candidatus Paceibacterota bacterium]|nr:GspE/PulE family protein [Candidatus Paceibacterota bacterium]